MKQIITIDTAGNNCGECKYMDTDDDYPETQTICTLFNDFLECVGEGVFKRDQRCIDSRAKEAKP